MENLIRSVLEDLGAKVAILISSQYELPQAYALKVLPSIAPLVISQIQERLANDDDWLVFLDSILKDLYARGEPDFGVFFKEDDPTGAILCSHIFGPHKGVLINNLGANLMIKPERAKAVLEAVVPVTLSYIAVKASGSLENLKLILAAMRREEKFVERDEEVKKRKTATRIWNLFRR